MSLSPQDPRTAESDTDIQTPTPKKPQAKCPFAPVKCKGESSTQQPSRQVLNSGQIRQLRKSWSKAAKRALEDQ